MLLLCVTCIFRILEVIDRFITSQFRRRCNEGNSIAHTENFVGWALQKQLFLAR